jgi:hypothetical protein
VRRGRCQLRDTVPPTFVRLTRRALKGGRRNPRGGVKYFFHVYTGQHRDVRPAGTVFFVAISPARPSPPLQCHSGHFNTIPDAVKAHGDRTSPRLLLCLVRPPVNGSLEPARRRRPNKQPLRHHPRSRSCRAQDSPQRPNRSKICQDGRQLRGSARHASTRRKIVRHACKLLSPWPIKGGAVPQPQGTDTRRRTTLTCTLSAFTTILALTSISISGTWRTSLLSRLTCSTPLQAHGASQYSALSTPLLDVRPRSELG